MKNFYYTLTVEFEAALDQLEERRQWIRESEYDAYIAVDGLLFGRKSICTLHYRDPQFLTLWHLRWS
jgi:hypothetical protein